MDLALTPTPAKLLPFTDAAFSHHHHPTPPPPACYKECMKNHAAAISGHAVDGCGEFMPSPTSLKCAACGCHRNFHRREPDSPTAPITPPFLDFRHPTQKLLALSTAAAEGHHQAPARPIGKNPAGIKRFRSKFSQEQKEKMQSFSEKLGWKMQQCDEDSIEEFCNGIEVAKGVFKVWMHNNKNTIGKKESNGRVRKTLSMEE